MAQNSLVIANQSRPEVRAAINNAFATLATKHSGFNEPTETYPLMEWADTTSGKLKIRNIADDAWLELGILDEPNLGLVSAENAVKLEHSWQGDGSASSKSFAFPTATKVIDFDVSGSALSDDSGKGFIMTFSTGDTSGDNTEGLILFTLGGQSIFGGLNSDSRSGPNNGLIVIRFDGELETFAAKGNIAIAPNGRVVMQSETFVLGTPPDGVLTSYSIRRTAWTVTSGSQNLDSLTIKGFQLSDAATTPFPTGFNIRLYSKGVI